jgi:ribosomal protein L7/L12
MKPTLCGRCGAPLPAGARECSFCGVGIAGATGPAPAPRAPSGSDEDIVRLIRSRNKIEAIKIWRQRYRVGLREAKDAVEALEKKLGL